MEKITRIDAMDVAIANCEANGVNELVIEKLVAIRKSLAKKSNTPKKPTASQVENDRLRGVILEAMELDTPYTLSEIATLIGIEGATSQRMTGLIREFVISDKNPEGVIERFTEKRKTYFKRVA